MKIRLKFSDKNKKYKFNGVQDLFNTLYNLRTFMDFMNEVKLFHLSSAASSSSRNSEEKCYPENQNCSKV